MCCYVFISLFAIYIYMYMYLQCIYIYKFAIYIYIFICNIYIYKFAIYIFFFILYCSLFFENHQLNIDSSGGGLSHECLVAAVPFWLGNFIHVFHLGRHDCVMTAIVKI